MPYPIYLNFTGKDDKALNETQPLYLKAPKDCTEEEYKDFYRKTFHDYHDPLFWIHLNMDYPFRLKGSCTFRRSRARSSSSAARSSCTATRCSSPTTSRRSFPSTCCF